MVYGRTYHLPIELEHKVFWAIKFLNFVMEAIGEKRVLQLNALDEIFCMLMRILNIKKNELKHHMISISWFRILILVTRSYTIAPI